MSEKRFRDRVEAGKILGRHLAQHLGSRENLIVLALPRGGVPIGYEVALALGAPLDVFVVRKLGFPGQEELAMGAIARGGVCVLNEDLLRQLPISRHLIDSIAAREGEELERRERRYRGSNPPLDVSNRTVVIVDDGLATGSTMRAAVRALRQMHAREIIVAVPVAARQTCSEFRSDAEEIICLRTPEPFHAVGLWYEDFSQTTDEEVQQLLEKAAGR